MTGRHDLNSKVLSALSVATGHSQVSTTFSHYIHTSDHHLYHISSVSKLWNSFDFSSIDHITSYAHLLPYETVKKRRIRENINTSNLLGSLYATTEYVSTPSSGIKTTLHPEKELLNMNTNSTDSKIISLTDIDKILLLYCTLADNNNELIAERLYLDTDQTSEVIKCFKEKKLTLGFTGYNLNGEPDGNIPDEKESPSETVSLHQLLPGIQNKLDHLSSNETSTLQKGVDAWMHAYYPKKRYRPLVFSSPNDVIDFINGVQIIDLKVTDMIATTPEPSGKWYQSNSSTATLEIITDDKSTQFKFNHISLAKNIPLPLSRERITNKERISLSIDKNAKSNIAYQKRLHRLFFLLSIYLNFSRINTQPS